MPCFFLENESLTVLLTSGDMICMGEHGINDRNNVGVVELIIISFADTFCTNELVLA